MRSTYSQQALVSKAVSGHWFRLATFARKRLRRCIDLPQSASESWAVGQLVSVAVPIRAREISLTIPRNALVLRNNGTFVFRVSVDNVAERIQVEVGDSSGELIAVRGSLNEGDRVAIRGAESLRDGSEIRIMSIEGG